MSASDTALFMAMATALWITAAIFTTVFHELGHALADLLLGGCPTLHHNWVQTSRHGVAGSVIVTGAGPLASLVQGLLCLGVLAAMQGEGAAGPLRLWILHLAFMGCSATFGYLLITPFAGAGDMNKIARLLGWGIMWQSILAVFGALLLTGLARYAGHAYQALNPFEVGGYRLDLAVFAAVPWLVGSLILLALNGTAQDFIVKIFPFFLGFYIFIAIADGPAESALPRTPMDWGAGHALLAVGFLVIAAGTYVWLKPGVTLCLRNV